jgi:RecB family exonuclease
MTNSGEELRLSYSSISTYEKCPLQYKCRYVDRLEYAPSPALSFGSSLHAALEWLYSVKTPHPPDLPSLLARLDEEWVSEGYADESEESRYREHAVEVLTNFYQRNLADFRLPASLEEYFALDLEDFVLTGKIDRIDRLPDGSYEIIDYKTNRKLPRKDRLASDLQLPIYQYAASREFGIRPSKLTFYYLLPDQRFSTRPWDEERLLRMLEELRGVARAVRSGEFGPTPNPLCPWCDFKELCPSPPASEDEKWLARLVDKYADLERRRLVLEGMMEGLSAELEEAWPEGDEVFHSRRNALRRRPCGEGPRFSLEP